MSTFLDPSRLDGIYTKHIALFIKGLATTYFLYKYLLNLFLDAHFKVDYRFVADFFFFDQMYELFCEFCCLLGEKIKLLIDGTNVPSKSLLSVRGMKGCLSSGEYYPRQGSFGFLSQNQGALRKKKRSSLRFHPQFPYFIPKIKVFSKKKKVFTSIP